MPGSDDSWYGRGEKPDEQWYGNGPKPDNKFYGVLAEEVKMKGDLLSRLQSEVEKKQLELLKIKYPNLKAIADELISAKEVLAQAHRDVDTLEEEMAILKKLYGADDDG